MELLLIVLLVVAGYSVAHFFQSGWNRALAGRRQQRRALPGESLAATFQRCATHASGLAKMWREVYGDDELADVNERLALTWQWWADLYSATDDAPVEPKALEQGTFVDQYYDPALVSQLSPPQRPSAERIQRAIASVTGANPSQEALQAALESTAEPRRMYTAQGGPNAGESLFVPAGSAEVSVDSSQVISGQRATTRAAYVLDAGVLRWGGSINYMNTSLGSDELEKHFKESPR